MRTILIACLFLLAMTSKAQIYNSGFENWTNMGSYEVPDQWGTLNHATSHLNVYTVTKWNPGSPGAYFMKITSKMYGMNVINGIAVYGKLDSTTMQPISGYPFTLRPEAFTGQWQHMIWGTSQGSVSAVLTKWNVPANKRDTVAIAYEELFDMAMSWEPFSVNFNYSSSDQPDSCMIILKASGDTPELNDYLWVDDLGFSGFIGIEDHYQEDRIKVYPIPADKEINIGLVGANDQKFRFELIDVSGRMVFSEEQELIGGTDQHKINVSQFNEGIYFLHSVIGGNSFFRKIIIN